MAESIFDPSWYRVAGLKPYLRMHGQIHKHEYRDQTWYVLQDHASNRFHRFTPETYQLIKLMDGKRTVQEIFERVTDRLGDDAPTQTDTVQLLGQLYNADMLQSDVSPDTSELFKRYKQQKNQKIKQTLRTPFAIRIPFVDPDRFLKRFAPFVRFIFSMPGFLLWLGVVVTALVFAGQHWVDLTENIADRVLAPQNLLLLWLIFPAIKILHELGHGFATKVWGGEVHEMGIMLLVFMPVPYVDASSSSAFREQRRRVIVGAAGMMVELFVAAIAMFVWMLVEPGLVKSIAFNVMLIAGVSTILFNANPLLRFDGYYILADLVEIPNLAKRSNTYFFHLVQRYIYGMKEQESPASSFGEQRWFLFYSIASFFYRMFIYFTIILFISGKFFVVGILLALWAIATMMLVPVFKGLKYLAGSNKLHNNRFRAISMTGVMVGALYTFFFVIPLPWHTVTEGVVWPPEKAYVRMGASSFVDKVLVKHGDVVSKGQALVECKDPLLKLEIDRKQFELEQLRAQLRALRSTDPVKVKMIQSDIERAKSELVRAIEKEQELLVLSPVDGIFYMDRMEDLPARHLSKGDVIGHVLSKEIDTVRVVVSQNDADLVRRAKDNIEVRLVTDINKIIPAKLQREVPAGTKDLPSATLSGLGGGDIALDPRENNQLKTFERVFQFDLRLAEDNAINTLGSRVYVRFFHGDSPLASRWYMSLKQLLLRNFDV